MMPAANARIGDQVVFRPEKASRWLTGIIVTVGHLNDRGHNLNIAVQVDGGEDPAVISPFDRTSDPDQARVLIFPPPEEIGSTEAGKQLIEYARKNELMIVRDPHNSDEVRYRFVSTKEGFVALRLVTKEIQSANLMWTHERGLYNNDLIPEGAELSFVAGSHQIDVPEDFETTW